MTFWAGSPPGGQDIVAEAYRGVVYLRTKYEDPNSISLLTSRTNVAPLKVTILWLKLYGAVHTAKSAEDQCLSTVMLFAWTDSMVVYA